MKKQINFEVGEESYVFRMTDESGVEVASFTIGRPTRVTTSGGYVAAVYSYVHSFVLCGKIIRTQKQQCFYRPGAPACRDDFCI